MEQKNSAWIIVSIILGISLFASAFVLTQGIKSIRSSGKSAGQLKSASVGVFQITPPYSNEISDYGINDTSSIDKEITAVITCTFEIK